MGLITKEVEVTINNKTVSHYKNLRYEIPTYKNNKNKLSFAIGEKIKINVEDLLNSSGVKVDVQCDNCGKILNIKYYNYKKYVKEDEKYYCRKCACKLYSGKNIRKRRLKSGKSFEKWCIENSRQDILNRWDYELNELTPNQINYKTKEKYYFKCLRELHESELKNVKSFTNGLEGSMCCNTCNSFAQWGIDNIDKNFLEKYWDYEKNKNINPWEIGKCVDKKVWIKCQEKDYHGSYLMIVNGFTKQNQRCPYCTNRCGKVHKLDSLGTLYPKVLKIWSDKNKKLPYEYSLNSNQKVWWKCKEGKHNDYLRSIISSNKYEFRCPECVRERDESFLQEKVRLYLNELRYTVLHEHNCTLKCINPKTKNQLPYDNEIEKLKLIIEVHGGQHYLETSGKWFNKNFNFYKRKLYDRYKRMYAKSKGYEYLEIPFWLDDRNETWKQLINEKISIFKCSKVGDLVA